MLTRAKNAAALKGRERLRDALGQLGFELK
jgi:hypothetical protein